MNISDVQIFLAREDGNERLRAYASIVIDACFVVRDLKIIDGPAGLFVAMPAKKRKDGTFRDIAHPVNQEARAFIEQMVLAAYQQQTDSDA